MDLKNQIQKREIKFRAWHKSMNRHISIVDLIFENGVCKFINIGCGYTNSILSIDEFVLEQFTGLKDKNEPNNVCIYEGDIVSLQGIIIGNIHENTEMEQDKSNIVIKGIGTKDWRATEKEAMDRGCFYSK